ncbi:MAG: hypothetical protein IPO47_19815 [Bacteroidetes bacterium]|nr:hypothetical protein [Bacteroidota bacterium]
MRNAQVIYCDFPIEERINYLVTTYGNFDHEGVIESVKRITKKLGGQHASSIEAYEAGDLKRQQRLFWYITINLQFWTEKRNPAQVKQMDMQKLSRGKMPKC